MLNDPVLLLADNGVLQFVRSSSGHTVHPSDVVREGFQASPEAAELILCLLKSEQLEAK